MKLKATEVFDFIYRNYKESYKIYDKVGFVLEGSSGSSKTFSIIQFLQIYAQRNKRKKILCGRSVMTWTITSIWKDFKDMCTERNFGFKWNNTRYEASLNNNVFRFVGADDPQKFHGPRQDVFWFNEAMELPQKAFNQVNMRTNDLFFLDYNPSYDKHWIFDTLLKNLKPCADGVGSYKITTVYDEELQRDISTIIFYLHSTFKMNAFLPAGQRQVIMGYEPTPDNIENGTADEWHWDVYGLGKRARPKGQIFPHIKPYIELPEDAIFYRVFGVDFGGNDPNTLVELNFDKKNKRVFIKQHLYQPEILISDFADLIWSVNPSNDEVVCESASKDRRHEFADRGINVVRADKSKINNDFRHDVIYMAKEYEIFFHEQSADLWDEQRNFKWAENRITGEFLSKPEDAHNHGFDGIFYATRYYHTNYGWTYIDK